MVNFLDVVNLQLMLFTLMSVGFFLRKKNLVTKEAEKSIINALINVLLPCMIIESFNIEFSKDILSSFVQVIVIGFVLEIVYIILSKFIYFMANKDQKNILSVGTICSNAGYIGMPVSQGVFGTEGLLLASAQCLPIRIFTWTVCTAMFVKGDSQKQNVVKTIFTHPCIMAVFIGMVLMFLGFPLPVFLNNSIKSLGGCSTAFSMMVIGMILAETDIKTIFNKLVLYFATVRLIIIPIGVLIVMRLLKMDNVVAGVSVLLAGMPAGTNSAVLAAKYNGDKEFASKNIFVSTMLSMFTIPLISLLL